MSMDKKIEACIEMLVFLHSLEGEEANIGVKMEREDDSEWDFSIRDFNDEALYEEKGPDIEELVDEAVSALTERVEEEKKRAEELLEGAKAILEKTA